MKHLRKFILLLPAVLITALCLTLSGCVGDADGSSGKAQFRVLNVSPGYPSIDLTSTDSDGETDTSQFSGLGYGSVSEYISLKADSYTLKLRKTGASGNLLSLGATLAEDTYTTYVAYGTTNHFAVLSLDETIEEPNSGYVKVQVLNTTSTANLDVYLSGSEDSLDDVSATIASAAAGSLSSITTINSGVYRLRITASGDKADLRLDVSEIDLPSQGVISIVLTDTAGGVLVNAVVLPQQGSPTTHTNNMARVRAAVGLSTGSAVTVTVGGSTILSRRPARSFISDAYSLLAAGSNLATVYVDNVEVASVSGTLEAGRDYTLFVWNTGGVVEAAFITDDNHYSSSLAKLRVLNGMSGLAAPVTLAIDYSPIIEYIDVGSASSYSEVSSGSDYQLDVTNANTAVSLLTREDIVLQAGSVYTFFLAGGGDTAAVGTLRKDR